MYVCMHMCVYVYLVDTPGDAPHRAKFDWVGGRLYDLHTTAVILDILMDEPQALVYL